MLVAQSSVSQQSVGGGRKPVGGGQKAIGTSPKPVVLGEKPVVNEFTATDAKALALPDSLAGTTNSIASYIKANFATEKERVRAVFVWLGTNIEYDTVNMYAVNYYEKEAELISKPLLTRKGICANYAALFTDICSKVGIKSFVVTGYTKQGRIPSNLAHAWNAAQIDNVWWLFDATWASGSIVNGRLVKNISNYYFMASPSKLIKSHLPFDYLWQLLNYPIENQAFNESRTVQDSTKPFFSFADSIAVYEKQSPLAQKMAAYYRIEKNGIRHALVFDELQHLKNSIEVQIQNEATDRYNHAVADYNQGAKDLNAFINFKNQMFLPEKTDEQIQALLINAIDKLNSAKAKLSRVSPTENIGNSKGELEDAIQKASMEATKQQDWLTLYLSKGRMARKLMFYQKR